MPLTPGYRGVAQNYMTVKQPQRDFGALLHPKELRSALLLASLYVLAYESFQNCVIDHLRMLHFRGIDASAWKIDEDKYRRDVLSRDKHPLQASLLWFDQYGAIDAADLATADRLRATRNKLVHVLWKLLGTEESAPQITRLYGAASHLPKGRGLENSQP